MKSFQLGLIVAIALAVLLGVALRGAGAWVVAQPAPATPEPTAETSAIQAVGLIVTATVGTVQGQCATTTTAFVTANTTVYYCFKVRNTGVSGDESLTVHNVRTSRGLSRDLSLTLAPNTVQDVLFATTSFTDVSIVDVTNFVTWTAQTPSNQQFIATARARIDIVNPSVNVVNTVGQDRTSCPAARTVRIPSGQSAAFCISIQNTGDITLTNHTVTDPPLSINATFNYTLAPQQTLNILPTNMQALGITNGSLERTNVTAPFANNVSYTGRGVNNIQVTGASTATVEIGNTTVRMTKTVSTEPEDCSKSNSITLNPGTRVYYCVIIENTGVVTLTQHQLTENFLSIDVSFTYPLPPRQKLFVTNDFLARNNLPIVLGPFEVHPRFASSGNDVIEGTMTYKGSSPEGFAVNTSAGATVIYPNTPTNTPTDRPDPTNTNTPGPTNTPTNTPIPQTPTPTLTPTFTPETPSPTPTRSYAISLLQTPTPRSQVAGLPGAPPADQQQVPPTPDPNLVPTPFPDQQLPVQDPALATATQIAVDATTTAVAATATAIQLEFDNAQATAFALSQPTATSPLPTPTVDPGLPQDGGSAGLPVAPGAETATETPTVTPTILGQTPPVTGAPEGEVTVLPPVVTVAVGTETPGVVVLVVTNTPEAGQALPPGQRPIEYPTPTPTPDFVMAAARTFDAAVATFGWLWFLVGSLVFFVTAGIVAGLFFRQPESSRYALPEPDYWLDEEPPADDGRVLDSGLSPRTTARGPRPGSAADDEWPAELP